MVFFFSLRHGRGDRAHSVFCAPLFYLLISFIRTNRCVPHQRMEAVLIYVRRLPNTLDYPQCAVQRDDFWLVVSHGISPCLFTFVQLLRVEFLSLILLFSVAVCARLFANVPLSLESGATLSIHRPHTPRWSWREGA